MSVELRVASKLLECPVCFELFKQPKTLDCGHSLCKRCLKRLCEPCTYGYTERSRVQCPECRRFSQIERTKDGFRTNYALANLIAEIGNQKNEKLFKCTVCNEETLIDRVFVCETCKNECVCLDCLAKGDHDKHEFKQMHQVIQQRRIEFGKWKQEKLKSLSEFSEKIESKRTEMRVKLQKFESKNSEELSKVMGQFEMKMEKFDDFESKPEEDYAIVSERYQRVLAQNMKLLESFDSLDSISWIEEPAKLTKTETAGQTRASPRRPTRQSNRTDSSGRPLWR